MGLPAPSPPRAPQHRAAGEEGRARHNPAPARASCTDKSSACSDFPFGDGELSEQTRGSLQGASFAPPGISPVASARLSRRAKRGKLPGNAVPGDAGAGSEMPYVGVASPQRGAALSHMDMRHGAETPRSPGHGAARWDGAATSAAFTTRASVLFTGLLKQSVPSGLKR